MRPQKTTAPTKPARSLPPVVQERLRELEPRVRGMPVANKLWEEIFDERERWALYRLVKAEPRDPEIDDVTGYQATLAEQLRDGAIGNVLHRCFYRWKAIGMWQKLRPCSKARAILDMALELKVLDLVEYRRLSRALSDGLNRTRSLLPRWDRDEGKLWFGDKVAREVRSGRNIIKILDAFENHGWPDRIEDPISSRGFPDSQRLRESIRTLNDELKFIRFEADGTGAGMRWVQRKTRAKPARDR